MSTPEVETAPRLHIYKYLEIVAPGESDPIDPEPEPDPWIKIHMPQGQGNSMNGANADQETVTAMSADTPPPGPHRTEFPLGPEPPSGYFNGDNRRYIQQSAESSGLRAPDAEAEVPAISVNAGIMAVRGIGRRLQSFGLAAKNRLNTATELAGSARVPEIDTQKYTEAATRIGAMAIEAFDLRGEENKRKRRRLGAAALATTVVAVGGYFAQKYVPEIAHSHSSPSSPEAGPVDPLHLFKNPGGADNPLFEHHLTLTDHAHAIAVQAGHHLHKAGNALHTVHQHTKNIGHQIGKLHLNLNDYSYNIAHQLDPEHTTQLLSKAMKVWEHSAHFFGKDKNTQISLANGHIINPHQMHQLNEVIVRLWKRS